MNVLLLVLDSARRDRFGCYGYPRGTTPAIDDLAGSGMVFEQMISPASWTLPSHAALFTGLYPRENGTHRSGLTLQSGQTTLAQHLQRYGYETAFVSNNPLISRRFGLVDDRSLVVERRELHGSRSLPRTLARGLKLLAGRMDKGAAAANRAVIELSRKLSEPFFIFANYMECHGPYTTTRPLERRFVRRRYSSIEATMRRVSLRRSHGWDPHIARDDGVVRLLNDIYDGALAYLDARVGDLLEALDETRQSDRTIVIVMADHGEVIGDYGWIGHSMYLYDTLVRVPFIARIPGQATARVDGLMQLTDVFAGLCRLLGIPIPRHVEDRPFSVDPFSQEPPEGRTYAFAEAHPMSEKQLRRRKRTDPNFRNSPSLEMVQDNNFKLVVEPQSGKETLFDRRGDPYERNPLVDRPQERDRLVTALHRWRTLFPAVDAGTYSPEEEQALNARLEELGYI